jgi:hypothetical protein
MYPLQGLQGMREWHVSMFANCDHNYGQLMQSSNFAGKNDLSRLVTAVPSPETRFFKNQSIDPGPGRLLRMLKTN